MWGHRKVTGSEYSWVPGLGNRGRGGCYPLSAFPVSGRGLEHLALARCSVSSVICHRQSRGQAGGTYKIVSPSDVIDVLVYLHPHHGAMISPHFSACVSTTIWHLTEPQYIPRAQGPWAVQNWGRWRMVEGQGNLLMVNHGMSLLEAGEDTEWASRQEWCVPG